MTKSKKVFVRAKANKISIEETYRYKAAIADNPFMSFEKAEGKIKVEFLYDGEYQEKWRIHSFWIKLYPKSKLLKSINKRLRKFFKHKSVKKIAGWLRLEGLRKNIEARLVKRQDKKYFGADAIADVKKHDPTIKTAQVGHLVLLGEKPSNFIGDWPSDNLLRLEIPIHDLTAKIAQSQKYERSYQYSLKDLEKLPVQLDDIKIIDVAFNDHNPFDEMHAKQDEMIELRFDLTLDREQPQVDEENKVPSKIIKQWWHQGKKEVCRTISEEEQEQASDDEEDEDEKTIYHDQIDCLKGGCDVEDLKWRLERLSRQRGGYLLIDLANKKNKKKNAADEDEGKQLKKQLLEAAFKCNLFVPLLPPYHCNIEGEKTSLMVVPVPKNVEKEANYHSNHLTIENAIRLIPGEDTWLSINLTEEVAKALSALANTAGGWVFLLTESGDDEDKIEKKFNEVRQRCRPTLDREDAKIHEYRNHGVYIRVRRNTTQVYSVDGKVYKWEKRKVEEIDSDQTFDLIKERYLPEYPLILNVPVISQAHLEWPTFDPREMDEFSYYDPDKKMLNWKGDLLFRQTPDHSFKITLATKINRPIELYKQQTLLGEIHVTFRDQIKSGLDVAYFNALGIKRPSDQGGYPEIKKVSKVIIEFEADVAVAFKKQGFTTTRQLEFHGVKPEPERLSDIQDILARLGLENIKLVPTQCKGRPKDQCNVSLQEAIDNGGFIITGRRPGSLAVELHVEFETIYLRRKRIERDRADKMNIQSGTMHLTIRGETDHRESSQELLNLINHLQHLLQERFEYIQFQVA